jgi:acyl carrier protein phosphodiesterase
MNYLAHLLLAGEDPEEKLGALMGDFTRGRLENLAMQYPPGIMQGIAAHRRIDLFTDRHHRFMQSKARFSKPRRRYAGIIVDVLYDHFLSHHWDRFSVIDRRAFISDVYDLLERNHHRLPERLQRVSTLMINQDWLGSYQHIDQIGEVYDRMSRRLRRPNTLSGSLEEVREHYPDLERDFADFFPALVDHTQSVSVTSVPLASN